MSWSIHPEIKNVPAAVAHKMVEDNKQIPQTIRDYIGAGINGLCIKHGTDAKVTVTGHGHLCDGEHSYEVTTASLEVRKGEEPVQAS